MSTTTNNPDSMKSTWRQDRSQWTIAHEILDSMNIYHVELGKEVPIYQKTDKIAYLPDWQSHRYILFYTGGALVIHELWARMTGSNFGPAIAFVFYNYAARTTMTRELKVLRYMGHQYGFLDGDKHERDSVPDQTVGSTLMGLMLRAFLRPLFIMFLSYSVDRLPSNMNLWLLPIQIGMYGVVLDFWFYWYHRAMHEVDGLWKFHRKHHLTKHPTPLLSLYADHVQEAFDVAGIPLMTYLAMKLSGFPMGFYEWFFCAQYVGFAEVAGHSGIRLHAAVPNPFTPLLRVFNAELVIEDHDLYYRRGWKKSANYGKQTRLWDRVFGTSGTRIKSPQSNVDYNTLATMPLFL